MPSSILKELLIILSVNNITDVNWAGIMLKNRELKAIAVMRECLQIGVLYNHYSGLWKWMFNLNDFVPFALDSL